jgi:hypothetical protein
MALKRKPSKTHIRLNTYNTIEGIVLIHVHSYNWKFLPERSSAYEKTIRGVIAQEKEQKRILVAFKDGQQTIAEGLF